MTRDEIVRRARACIGARFRPQGRAPSWGVDCVGLALVAWGLPPDAVRRDYRLRGNGPEALLPTLARFGRAVEAERPGDLLLARAGPGQPHLLVMTPGGFIHADAGAGRVEERPGPPAWPIHSVWERW